MAGRWLLLLAVVLCASPVLLSPIESRIAFKNIFNSFRSNPIANIQSTTTSKPTESAPVVQPTTEPAQVPNKPGPVKTSKSQQNFQNSPVAQIVLATQQAHVQEASVGTGKAAKPQSAVPATVAKNPRPTGVKKANGQRKRRPAGPVLKNPRPVPFSIHTFSSAGIQNAHYVMSHASPFTDGQFAIKKESNKRRPQRTRPGSKGKGKKGNKRRRRPAVNAARRQMNDVMDRLFQDFSKAMETRVEPVSVKLATFAVRGKVNKWAFVKAKQSGRKSRADEGQVEVAHDDSEETEATTVFPEEEEHEVAENVPEGVPEGTQQDDKSQQVEGRHGDEDEDEDEEEAAPATVGENEDEDDDEEEHEEEAEPEEADDSKKTVALPEQEPKPKPVVFKTAAKPVNVNEAIEKLAAAVQSHPEFDLPNPNILPDDEKVFATNIAEFESKDEAISPHVFSKTPVATLKPDGNVEYQLSITEDDEDEIIKAEQELLAKQELENRAGKPDQNRRRVAAKKGNKKKKQQLRRRINIQRRRLLKRENDLEYPSNPNAELHGLSKISRAGNVRIKSTKRTRLISVPVKFGPLSLETSDETEPALRNAKVTIASIHGVLRLSERNGRIVNAKLHSVYLRPRRAVVTLTRSAEFDATQDNKKRQLARVVTHFSNQMARLWNAQDLLPGILTTEFHKAFSQPDVIISPVSQQDSVLPAIVNAFKAAEKPAGVMKVEPQPQDDVVQEPASQDEPKVEPAKAPVDPVQAVQAIARVKTANKNPRPHVV